jgi:hypothetical protein
MFHKVSDFFPIAANNKDNWRRRVLERYTRVILPGILD